MKVQIDMGRYEDDYKFYLYLTKEDIKQLKNLKKILKKCDCRYSEDMDIIGIPFLDAIITEVDRKDG